MPLLETAFLGSPMFLSFSGGVDEARRAEIWQEVFEQGLLNQPRHIQHQKGAAEFAWAGTKLPTEQQLGRMQIPVFLQHSLGAWTGHPMAERLSFMKQCSYPLRYALREDLLDIIDWMPAVKMFLKGWQQEVNAATPWFLPGRFGALAALLIETGYLLDAPEAVTNYYGRRFLSRSELSPDHCGSPAFVAKAMGPLYLDWIAAVV
jgi:hypothetical protein